MAQATETFALGGTQVTTVVEIDLNTVWLISGNFSGTIPAGQIGFINGNVNLTGDLIVEGFLTGVDTFTLEGNGHQILVQNGGQVNLQGVEKSGWLGWGEATVEWVTSDRLAVAPFTTFLPTVTTYGGTWETSTRPANSITPGTDPASPNLTLFDGTVVKPEVANLTRSITLKNLSRFHFHDDPGVQILKHLAAVNSGITGVLAQYPIHFHLCGESVRGSLIEGVVVEGGKNHAFVVHGSHGVTLRDTVAYNTTGDAYWWDVPNDENHTANNSNDTLYDHTLAMWVKSIDTDVTLTAYLIGAGSGNGIVGSVACCVFGGENGSGYHWTSKANQNIGGSAWLFERNVSHNNKNDGVFVWQNEPGRQHFITDFIAYKNGRCQIEHGAYTTNYHYKNMVLMGGNEDSFRFHSRNPGVLLENVIADRQLLVTKHTFEATAFTIVKNCQFPSVRYSEIQGQAPKWSWIRYEDCDLVPSDFTFTSIHAQTLIEITEGGVLTHRWAGGWT